jgi:hypothetical protein
LEIQGFINNSFNVKISPSHLGRILRDRFKKLFAKAILLGKPYTPDYRLSKYYIKSINPELNISWEVRKVS